jgi:hypothetical protein
MSIVLPRLFPGPRALLLCLSAATAAACGGGGSGEPTIIKPSERIPNFVRIRSDPGDPVGRGQTYEYSQANAIITAADVGYLTFTVNGDQVWYAVAANAKGPMRAGTYTDADWSGPSRGCGGTYSGTLTIDSVSYQNGSLAAIDFRLDQVCVNATGGLHATVHWRADDPTLPTGPVAPIPAELWKPDPALIPASGNYTLLVSGPGEYIGQGITRTIPASLPSVVNGALRITAGAFQGDFRSMLGIPPATVGYYPGLMGNPARGSIYFTGEGRGCSTMTGWFVVDRAVYVSGALTALDLRFEQHCDGMTPALHGAVHYSE